MTQEAEKKPTQAPVRCANGHFAPGNTLRKGKGRGKGNLNKTTVTVKEALNAVAAEIGYDGKGEGGHAGYLKRLAETNPDLFVNHWLRATVPAASDANSGPQLQGGLHSVTLTPIATGSYLPPDTFAHQLQTGHLPAGALVALDGATEPAEETPTIIEGTVAEKVA